MKKLTVKIIVTACLVMLGVTTYAQLNTNERPVSFSLYQMQWSSSTVTLPVLNMTAINREDSIDEANDIPPRFGYPHKVKLTLENAGEWKVLPNGDRLWHLTIACPGAKSINLLYDKYWLPEGAKLFVYSKDKIRSIGAFTSKNNKGTKDELRGFATGLVYSDTVVVEYYEPKEVAYTGVVSIAYVVQGYRYINVNRNSAEYGGSGSCQVNVNCQEGQEWQNEKNAVALILVNGYRYCTGSLINTTANDNRPLFLTANHCLGGWANNNTAYDAITNPYLDHYSFWWHYESPGCSNPANEPSHYSTSGATVVANNSASDFALLSLTEDPKDNPNIKTYYLGWDRSGNAGTGGVGIHHPSGDVKKISTYNLQPSTSNCFSSGNNNFWKIKWISTSNGHSVTEGGSSGSPLINSSRKVIGQLYGAGYCSNTNCSDPANDVGNYGKFSVSWTGNGAVDNRRKLQPWLDSLNTGSTTLDGVGTTPDLYVRDFNNDNGTEPHSVECTWESPDIWLEDMNGNVIDSATGNSVCKVCVRIHNRSNKVSLGTEKLFLNWAKAGTNEFWSDNWTNLYLMPCGSYKGGTIGNPNGIPIPVIPPHGNTVMRVDWWAPSPDDYVNCTEFNTILWHFCLMARVHDGYVIAHENEQFTGVHEFIRNHNNVASRNISVKSGSKYESVISVNNATITGKGRIICLSPKVIGNISITDYAEVYITLDAGLLAAIDNTNISGLTWVSDNTLRWNGGSACIPVTLPANSYYTMMTTVHFLANQIPANNTFEFDIVLRNANGDSILGGEHYKCVRTEGRYFQTCIYRSESVLWGEPVTLTACDIEEDAEYIWYDDQGEEVGYGLTCYVAPLQPTTYTLRVTADEDGYRSYCQLTVNVTDGELRMLAPNPADNQVRIGYALSRNVSSATLQILNGIGQVVHSQVLNGGNGNKVTGETLVNTSSWPAGSYTVRLISSKGKENDSKVLVIK